MGAPIVDSVLVAGVTLGWPLDNTLSRPLSELDPGQVVAGKGAIGAALSEVLALALGEPPPTVSAAVALLAREAVGYGGSLRLYLRAQRILGSTRTGSVFAVAPVLGALVAFALGEPVGGMVTAIGAVLIAIGVYLHLTEKHHHDHEHPVSHDHTHRHEDGHHNHHSHEGIPVGMIHADPHTLAVRAHRHAHGEDVHHCHHG